jgi:two-component system NtrC family response regulator
LQPINLKLLRIILSRTFKIPELEDANRRLQRQTIQSGSLCGMLGVSPIMEDMFKHIKHISKTEYPVLINGDTGTGKEMAACAVHSLS